VLGKKLYQFFIESFFYVYKTLKRTGPKNVKLLVTHKEVETFGFQDEVGRLILDICKTMPYGILCFFPSYSLLKKLLGRWQDNGMTKEIEVFKKIFSETKYSEKLLSEYYECVNSNTNGNYFFEIV
jgi:Fanconi anemia group J protein